MLIVTGAIDVDPAEREEYLRHADVVAAASRAEAGCLAYAFCADRADPGRILVFERWVDGAALKAHITSAHLAAYRDAVAHIGVKNREFFQYEVASERKFG